MAEKLLESSALSAFCGSVATMLSAGIQTEEAVVMLGDNRGRSRFQDVCATMYDELVAGSTFAHAMQVSGGFPRYAIDMVATGEHSGHLEQVLRNLELYYDEEDRMFAKLRTSLGYPAALLMIMAVILLLTVLYILPMFAGVYRSMAGNLIAQSAISVDASMTIGWVALGVTVVCAAVAYYFAISARSEVGRERVVRHLERIPVTSKAMYRLALSRFTAVLATFVSSGITHEEAMTRSLGTVGHAKLRKRVQAAHDAMVDLDHPLSLAQAIGEKEVFEPLYARMLNVGSRSGTADETLAQLSQTFFDDAVLQIDHSLDHIEPILAAFLTAAVGVTLIAVMLPLVGVMIAIG